MLKAEATIAITIILLKKKKNPYVMWAADGALLASSDINRNYS